MSPKDIEGARTRALERFFFTVLYPGRRGDHFGVRSSLDALACHPRTSKERIRAPWNVLSFFSFFPFLFFFALLFFPFKAVLPYKHHTLCRNHFISKDPKSKQYRTAFT